jgi:exodeoxyribonuclease VIII
MKLGFNKGVSNADYHADREFLSSSSLKLLNKCPREFYKKYVKEEKEEDEGKAKSANLVFGSLVHTLILEPEMLEEEYVLYTGEKGKSSNEYKNWKKGLEEAGDEREIITQSQLSKASMLTDIVNESEYATGLLDSGEPEKTLCVELDGVKIKVRADWYDNEAGAISDVKTTSGGLSYEEVQRACLDWGYALSAALYVDCFAQETGKSVDFYFIFVGKSPMGCEVYKASEQFLEYGRKQYKKAIKQIKESRESGVWFNEGIRELSMPEHL